MLSAIIILIGLSLLILVHELGHFIAAKKAGLLVEEFGFGFPPRIFAKKFGETEYSINWLPFGGFVRIYGERTVEAGESPKEVIGKEEKIDKSRSFSHQSAWKRFVIMGAGIAINFFVGWILLSLVFMIGTRPAILITEVLDNTPAFSAGLMSGDVVLGFSDDGEFISTMAGSAGEEVAFQVLRGNETVDINIVPRTVEQAGGQGALGVMIAKAGVEGQSFFTAIYSGLKMSILGMGEILRAFGSLLADLFGHASIPANIVGPVGIFGIADQLGSLGFVFLLQLIGIISLNLAVLNFIPFPALDGGRILFLIIEKIKGSPLSAKAEIWANAVSFVFLILLMVVITGRDIINLF